MHWTGSYDVLYGYQLGLAGHIVHTDNGVVTDTTVNDVYDHSLDRHAGLATLFSSRRIVWLSQMVHYTLQPHSVISTTVRGVVQQHLHSSSPTVTATATAPLLHSHTRNARIPRPFATLFLTDTTRNESALLTDALRCVRVLQRRAPFIKSVFLPLDSLTHFTLIRRYCTLRLPLTHSFTECSVQCIVN